MSFISQLVNSSELVRQFPVHEKPNILSFFGNKLLIGERTGISLDIYNLEGHFLWKIKLDIIDKIFDAIFTSRGNIMYTTNSNTNCNHYNKNCHNKVVTITEDGEEINRNLIKLTGRLSISSDGIIYIACYGTGIYRSTDEGQSWNLMGRVFNYTDGNLFHLIFKTITDSDDYYWSLIRVSDNNLHVYKAKTGVSTVEIIKEFNFVSLDNANTTYNDCFLTDDGKANILVGLIGNYVKVFTAEGQFYHHLLSLQNLNSLTIDRKEHLLYVGTFNYQILVYKLIYVDMLI